LSLAELPAAGHGCDLLDPTCRFFSHIGGRLALTFEAALAVRLASWRGRQFGRVRQDLIRRGEDAAAQP